MKTRELYAGNLSYGFASELKLAAGIPLDRPLRGLIPHGIFLSDEPSPYDAIAVEALGTTFTYPAYLDAGFRKLGRVMPIASPVAYAIGRLGLSEGGSGYLYMPAHSTDNVTVTRDTIGDIESLKAEVGDDVTVCLHYQDRSRADYYAEHFEVVTLGGDRLDQTWCQRMLGLFGRFEYVISDDFGSSLVYALGLGKKVFIRGTRPEKEYAPDFERTTSGSDQRLAYLRAALSDPDDERHAEIAEEYLRLDMLKPADELRADLLGLS